MMTRGEWKFSFCSLHFQCWFKFLEKVLIWIKNVTSAKKLTTCKVESYLKSNFWPKSIMQNSTYTKLLNSELWQNWLALYFYLSSWKYFGVVKKCQKIGVGRGLGRVRAKNLLAQIIPDKICRTKWSNPIKLDRRRKVWYLFLRVF